ncbi:fibrinolytic enzyme, isozyme C-like [Cimex lectularius]|uniref:Peptidase S1 domain-containing protein n=1 Tax=Cimex lectularius TaxID=79782 RepID=A0A8I6RGW4_CIMLE|nr:fibrinolytic enzyme, isozyme C-like [Cimex lectularius]
MKTNRKDNTGGREVMPGEFPFAVYMSGKIFCGGTLFEPDKFFTAGDCFTAVEDFKVESVTIIAGSVSIEKGSIGRQERNLKSYKTHEKFKQKSHPAYYFHNIAIAYLDTAFTITDSLKTITFPSYANNNYEQMWYDYVASGKSCFVVGWGKNADGTKINVLKAVEVKPWTDAECSSLSKREEDMTSKGEACASAVASGDLIVPADAGSALYCEGQVYGMVTAEIRAGNKRVMGFILFWPYLEYFNITKKEVSSGSKLHFSFYLILIFITIQLYP